MHSMVVQFHEFKYWYFHWIVHCYHIWFPTELMVFCKAICPSSLLIWFVYLSSFASSLSIWLICYSSFFAFAHYIFFKLKKHFLQRLSCHQQFNYIWVIPCQVMQAWTWPISKFDKNLPNCCNIYDMIIPKIST